MLSHPLVQALNRPATHVTKRLKHLKAQAEAQVCAVTAACQTHLHQSGLAWLLINSLLAPRSACWLSAIHLLPAYPGFAGFPWFCC